MSSVALTVGAARRALGSMAPDLDGALTGLDARGG